MNVLKKINFVFLFVLFFLIEINQIQAKEPVNFNTDITISNDSDHGFSNTIIMQQGDIGQNVMILQEKLSKIGIYDGPITGYFGLLTQEAVTNFQELNGLIPTGKVDKITNNMILNSTDFYSNSDDSNDEESVPTIYFGTVPLSPSSKGK